MKKGFTLVEVSIVLVVIGLLMFMAYQGIGVWESSKRKSDINKIIKIKNGLNGYYAKYGVIPGFRGTATIITSKDIVSDLLGEGMQDLDFEVVSRATYLHFTGCVTSADNRSWVVKDMKKGQGLDICLYESTADPLLNSSASGSGLIAAREICYYEKFLDDENASSGEGRTSDGSDLPSYKCEDLTDNKTYLYKVF